MRVDPAFCLRRAEQIIDTTGAGLPVATLKRGLRAATQLRCDVASDSDIPIGASHFGGSPHLPSSTEWPRWDGFFEPDQVLDEEQAAGIRKVIEAFGKPAPEGELRIPRGCNASSLSFLAQLNLSEIPDPTGLLPATGWLCFFYDAAQQPWGFDPRNRGAARVLYFDAEPSLLRRTEAPPSTEVFSPRRLRTEIVATLPRWSYQLGLELENAAADTYWELAETRLPGEGPHHRVLGWPKQVQGEMDRECQLVTHGIYCGSPEGYQSAEAERLKAGVRDWMMLLQLDSDDDGPGWMWGDAGCLYYWIRKQDLAERRFDKIWTILQCY